MYMCVRSNADCLLYDISNTITVGTGKYQGISFTCKRNPIIFPCHFNNIVIERTQNVRDVYLF